MGVSVTEKERNDLKTALDALRTGLQEVGYNPN